MAQPSQECTRRRRQRGLCALAATLLLAAGACTAGNDPQVTPLETDGLAEPAQTASPEPPPTPEPPGTPTPTATPTPADPYAIPADAADIDKAYVQRVLDALAAVQGEAFRQLAADGAVTPAVEEITGNAYAFDAYEATLGGYANILERDPELERVYDEPDDPRVQLEEIVHQGRDCTFVEVREDFSDVFVTSEGPSSRRQFYALGPYNDPAEPGNPNPTPWKYSLTFFYEPDAPDPENSCEGYD